MRHSAYRTALAFTIASVLILYVSGAVLALSGQGLFGISKMLFLRFDIVALLVGTIIVLLAAFLAPRFDPRELKRLLDWIQSSWSVPIVAAVSFLIAVIGTRFVYFEFALSMDEWMPRLQSMIFREGRLVSTVEESWRPWGHLMYHHFAVFDPDTGRLASNYRPGLAALIALLDSVGLGSYISTFFHLGSVVLVAAVTRQISPEHRFAPVIAALLLATSIQTIAAAMTTYAMTAHLFFNLLWLNLFLRQKLLWHVCAALVGVVTASLHQVHMHFFFALPFLLLLLNPLNLRAVAIYSVIYAVGHLAVISWDYVLIDQQTGITGNNVAASQATFDTFFNLLKLPSLFDLATVWTNIIRLFIWQNVAFLPLLIVYATAPFARNRYFHLLTASVAFSLLPYLFLMPDQGHGWGYRYLHGLLGNLTILAAVGCSWLMVARPKSNLLSFVVLLFIASCIVMVPLRFFQIASFVKPYAEASTLVHAQDAEVVIVDNYSTAIGSDIPRNHPTTLRRPIAMYLSRASAADLVALCAKATPKILTGEDFEPLGIFRVAHNHIIYSEDHFFLFEVLNHSDCRVAID